MSAVLYVDFKEIVRSRKSFAQQQQLGDGAREAREEAVACMRAAAAILSRLGEREEMVSEMLVDCIEVLIPSDKEPFRKSQRTEG